MCRAGFHEKDGDCVFGYDKLVDKYLADTYLYGADNTKRTIYAESKLPEDALEATENHPTTSKVQITIVDNETSRAQNLVTRELTFGNGAFFKPVISPTGRYVAYVVLDISKYHTELRSVEIVDLETLKTSRIESKDFDMLKYISWSPDERNIALLVWDDSDMNFDDDPPGKCIIAMNVETKRRTKIYCSPLIESDNDAILWSPSGAHILFGYQKYEGRKIVASSYHTADIYGRNLKSLAEDSAEYWDFDARWSADGEWVLFNRAVKGGEHERKKVRFDGSSESAADEPQVVIDQHYFPYFTTY